MMEDPGENALVVVAAVIESQGRILICQRKRSGRHPLKWEFPGGKVEPGETPAAALARELHEELGVRAEVGPEILRCRYRYPTGRPILLLFHGVTSFAGEPRNVVFEAIRWTRRNELADYDFLEGDRDIVSRLSAGEF